MSNEEQGDPSLTHSHPHTIPEAAISIAEDIVLAEASKTGRYLRICGVFVVLGLLIAVLYVWEPQKKLMPVFETIREMGAPGAILFILLFSSFVTFLFPFFIFALVSGFIYKLGFGLLIAMISCEIAACSAFWVARKGLRKTLLEKFQHNRKFQVLEYVLKEKGWRVVILARLNVMFPFAFSNWAFGLLSVDFVHYAIVSPPGFFLEVLFYVYLGSVASNFDSVASGDSGDNGGLQTAVLIISLVLGAIVAIAFAYFGKKAFKEAEARMDREKEMHAIAHRDEESREEGADVDADRVALLSAQSEPNFANDFPSSEEQINTE
eukprot:ANDGO_04422.mRNA.1 TVP38/TMEM64 family membrane protein slr0305